MSEVHYRNYVFCRESEDSLYIENTFIATDINLVTASTIEYARGTIQGLNDELAKKDLKLLGTSYLGYMNKDVFNLYQEKINTDIPEAHYYLLAWRSLTNTHSVIISKPTQLMTVPTIKLVQEKEGLADFVLTHVEYLGFMSKACFEDSPATEMLTSATPKKLP